MEREEHPNTSALASGPAVASGAPAEGIEDPFTDDCLLPSAYLTADLAVSVLEGLYRKSGLSRRLENHALERR